MIPNTKNIEVLTRSLVNGGDIDKKLSNLEALNSVVANDLTLSFNYLEKILIALSSSINTSQTRVCDAGLSSVQFLLQRASDPLEPKFYKSSINILLPSLIDRLSDSKLQIRSKVLVVLSQLWLSIFQFSALQIPYDNSPNSFKHSPSSNNDLFALFSKEIIKLAFLHKSFRVREMILHWIDQIATTYSEFDVLFFIPNIVNLLFDNNDNVRASAKFALSSLYRNKPQIQQILLDELSLRKNLRPAIISEITSNFTTKGSFGSRPSSASPYRDSYVVPKPPVSRQFYDRNTPSRTSTPMSSNKNVSSTSVNKFPISSTTKFHPRLSNNYLKSPLPSRIPPQQSSTVQRSIQSPRIIQQNPFSTPNTNNSNPQTPKNSSSTLKSLNQEPFATLEQPQTPKFNKPLPMSPPLDIKPIVLDSPKFMESYLSEFAACLEGKETEDNWTNRDRFIHILRRLTWGNSPIEFPNEFCLEIKKQKLNILKVLSSLRTSLAINSILLLQEISFRLNVNALSLTDFIFESLLKLCATTKKMVANAALKSLSTFVSFVPSNDFVFRSLSLSINSKSIPLRNCCISICTSIVSSDWFNQSNLSDKNQSILSQIITKGVNDSSAKIRLDSKELLGLIYIVDRIAFERVSKSLDPKTFSSYIKQTDSLALNTPSNKFKTYQNSNFSPNSSTPKRPSLSPSLSTARTIPQPKAASDKKNSSRISPTRKISISPTFESLMLSKDSEYSKIPDVYEDPEETQVVINSRLSLDKNFVFSHNPLKNREDFQFSSSQKSPRRSSTSSVGSNGHSLTASVSNSDVSRRLSSDFHNLSIYHSGESFSPTLNQINDLPNYTSSVAKDSMNDKLKKYISPSPTYQQDQKGLPKFNNPFNNKPSTSSNVSFGLPYSELMLIKEFSSEPKIFDAFGLRCSLDKSHLDSIEKYLKISEIIDPIINNPKNITDLNNDDYRYVYSENDIKLISRFIKDNSCSWLWKLTSIPHFTLAPANSVFSGCTLENIQVTSTPSLFEKLSFVITFFLRLPLNSSTGFAETTFYLDLCRHLIRKRCMFILDVSFINQFFWELLRLREFEDPNVSGLSDTALNLIIRSVDTNMMFLLFIDLFSRCPLPSLELKNTSTRVVQFGSLPADCLELVPSRPTSKLEDPFKNLLSTRILLYSLDLFNTFVTSLADSTFINIYVASIIGYLVKAAYHPRTAILNTSIFAIHSIKDALEIEDDIFYRILSDSISTLDDSGFEGFFKQSEQNFADLEKAYCSILDENSLKYFSTILVLNNSHKELLLKMCRDKF
ncbi:hypothetical protein BB560_000251 [Smittium megazygosporum]|uniref:TOG domain-containing protein n=1 Tax=Smittium megazygosporum TaxID=133381 RepID=A0A2T9ZL29_9FUNG|nr:hypothetical protein BB560_000251 [Smittium megazygosporum]